MKKRYNLFAALMISAFMGFSQTATLPLFEDFENESQGSTSCNTANSINLSSTVFANSKTDDVDWSPDAGGTGSGSTGPSTDHNPGTSSGYYLYTEASSPCFNNNYEANLESVYMNLSSVAGLRFNFWYHMYGQSMGTMHVDMRVGSNPWTLDVTPSWTDNQDLWQQKSLSIFDTAFVGKDSVQIRIRGIIGSNFYSDMAIDNILLSAIAGLDLEATALASPTLPACPGTYSFALDVTNKGTSTVTNFKAYFNYNGSLVDSATYAGSLAPGMSTTVPFSATQTIAPGLTI